MQAIFSHSRLVDDGRNSSSSDMLRKTQLKFNKFSLSHLLINRGHFTLFYPHSECALPPFHLWDDMVGGILPTNTLLIASVTECHTFSTALGIYRVYTRSKQQPDRDQKLLCVTCGDGIFTFMPSTGAYGKERVFFISTQFLF